MKASDVFGLIVRTIGVIVLLLGGGCVFGGFLWAVGPMCDAYVVYGLACIGVGFSLLRNASWFVSFSYPDDGNSSEQ